MEQSMMNIGKKEMEKDYVLIVLENYVTLEALNGEYPKYCLWCGK